MSHEVKGVDNLAYKVDKQELSSLDDVHVTVKSQDKKIPASKVEGDIIDRRYGYGKLKPKIIQGCNRMPVFVFWTFLLCFVEGYAINGIANAGLVQIERQFQLTSAKSGLIPSAQDIGALIVVLFVSFIGGRYSKPVWVATGSLLMALGSLLFMVPHFATKYEYGALPKSSDSFCKPGSSGPSGPGPSCESKGEKYLAVFMLAQIIHGIGFTPMFTLGTVYIDENEDHSVAAAYIGLTYAAAAMGVAAGFFLGGQFVQKFFVEFDRIDQDTLDFDAKDPRWIGAWWLGFIISTVLFVIIAIPIFGFPKFMPKNNTVAAQKQDDGKSMGVFLKEMFITFFRSLLKLIKNPTFMFLTFGGCAETLIIAGVGAFSFKYLAEEFSLDFDTAGFYIGGLVLTGSVGMFLGGLLIRIFRLETVGMLRLNVVAAVIGGLLGLAYMASCPDVPLVGRQVSYPNKTSISGYDDSCQGACVCKSQAFTPVCGKDGNVYFSPCHAGCTSQNGPMMFGNCSCIAARLNVPTSHDTSTATSGKCPDNCTNLKVLAPCLFIALLAVLTGVTPTSMATLRCVDEDQRPFALGFQWLLLRLLATIPGPVLVGYVIDKACEVWAQGTCGDDGFCMMYNKSGLALGVMTWWIVVCFMAAVFFFIASLFAVRNTKSMKMNEST